MFNMVLKQLNNYLGVNAKKDPYLPPPRAVHLHQDNKIEE